MQSPLNLAGALERLGRGAPRPDLDGPDADLGRLGLDPLSEHPVIPTMESRHEMRAPLATAGTEPLELFQNDGLAVAGNGPVDDPTTDLEGLVVGQMAKLPIGGPALAGITRRAGQAISRPNPVALPVVLDPGRAAIVSPALAVEPAVVAGMERPDLAGRVGNGCPAQEAGELAARF